MIEESFNGSQENESAPKSLHGKEVHDRVSDIITIFGKIQKKPVVRQTPGRKGPFSLSFLIGLILLLDIV